MNTETTNPIPSNGAATTVDLDAAVAAMATPAAAPSTETIIKPVESAAAAETSPKRRGRPPGSKNRRLANSTSPTAKKTKATKKAAAPKRGRPPGTKNKTKAARKTSRVAGVKAQAQVEKAFSKRCIAEAKASKTPISHIYRDYLYRGAKYTPAGE